MKLGYDSYKTKIFKFGYSPCTNGIWHKQLEQLERHVALGEKNDDKN